MDIKQWLEDNPLVEHELLQGSPEWEAFRMNKNGSSEAAPMLGMSKNATRTELLRMKHTGNPKEFSDWVQRNILDYGHEVEAMARPIVEKQLGRKLYPVVCSRGTISASCDGKTMAGDVTWEHKQYSAALFESVTAGILPDEHKPQCFQNLLVTGADKLIFTVSNGTEENIASMEVFPDEDWYIRLLRGWAQFDEDLANYQHVEVIPAAVGAPVKDLPAIIYKLDGLSLTSNLDEYKLAAIKLVEESKKPLITDQDFADRDTLNKKFGEAEKKMELIRSQVIGEIADVDAFCRDLVEIQDLIRQARLNGEKAVKSEKDNRRATLLREAQDKLAAHIKTLNERLGKPYMPIVQPEFQAVIKGLKSLDSMRDKLDTELARCKIEAGNIASRIGFNLAALRDLGKEFPHLFPDLSQIVTKLNDDFIALVKSRIADEHQRLEAVRIDAERQAQEKAEREAAAPPAPSPTAGNPPAPYPAATTAATSEPAMVRKGSPAPWNNARNRVVALLDRMTMHQLAEVEKHILATFPHLQEEAA